MLKTQICVIRPQCVKVTCFGPYSGPSSSHSWVWGNRTVSSNSVVTWWPRIRAETCHLKIKYNTITKLCFDLPKQSLLALQVTLNFSKKHISIQNLQPQFSVLLPSNTCYIVLGLVFVLKQGYTNPRHQVARPTMFSMVPPNICGPSTRRTNCHKPSRHLRTVDARMVTSSRFHTEDPPSIRRHYDQAPGICIPLL